MPVSHRSNGVASIPVTRSARPYFSLTLAQFRLLGRLRAGLLAPLARYWNPTTRALHEKGCIVAAHHRGHKVWTWTDLGVEALAAGGKMLPRPKAEA